MCCWRGVVVEVAEDFTIVMLAIVVGTLEPLARPHGSSVYGMRQQLVPPEIIAVASKSQRTVNEPGSPLATRQTCILGWMVLSLSLQNTDSSSEPLTDTTQCVVCTALPLRHIGMAPSSMHNTRRGVDEGAGKMASCERLGGPKVGTSQGCQTTCTAPEHVRLSTPAIVSTLYCPQTLPFY